jgi:hypothetical protein
MINSKRKRNVKKENKSNNKKFKSNTDKELCFVSTSIVESIIVKNLIKNFRSFKIKIKLKNDETEYIRYLNKKDILEFNLDLLEKIIKDNICTKYWFEKMNIKYNEESLSNDISILKNITKIKLSNTNIKDISKLNSVEILNLSNCCNITEISGFENLRDVYKLNLYNTNIRYIKNLLGLTNLRELNLSSTNISNINGIEKLKNLKKLDLSFTDIKDVSKLSNIQIKILDLSNCENISDESGIEKLNNLGELILMGTKINDVSKLRDIKIEILDLSLCYNITEKSGIEKLKNISKLILSHTKIKDISILLRTEIKNIELYGYDKYDINKKIKEELEKKILNLYW